MQLPGHLNKGFSRKRPTTQLQLSRDILYYETRDDRQPDNSLLNVLIYYYQYCGAADLGQKNSPK